MTQVILILQKLIFGPSITSNFIWQTYLQPQNVKDKVCQNWERWDDSPLLILQTANAQTAGLTQCCLVGLGPHFSRGCRRSFVAFLLPIAIFTDFGKKPEQSVFHFFPGETWKIKCPVLALTTSLTKRSHYHRTPAVSHPVAEQHHRSSRTPGLTTSSALEPGENQVMDADFRRIFNKDKKRHNFIRF